MTINTEHKVASLGFLITLLLAIAAYNFYQNNFQYRVAQYEQHVSGELDLLVTEVSTRMSSVATIAAALSSYLKATGCQPCYYPRSPNHQGFMASLYRRLPSIRTVIIVDESGVVVDDTRPGRPGVGIDVSDRDYFTAHLLDNSADLLVSDPVISRVDGKWTWVLSVPVRDDSGGLMAVAAVSLDGGYFDDLLSTSPVAGSRVMALVFGADTLLGISEQGQPQMGKPLQGLPAQPPPGERKVTYQQSLPWSRQPNVIWQHALQVWPMVVTVSQPQASINEQIEKTLLTTRWFLTGLVFLCGIISILLVVFLRKQRLAARALEDSRQSLEEAEELAQIGHFGLDLVSNQVSWSKGLHRLMGYDEDETLDYERVNREMHHPDDRERINKWLEETRDRGLERLPLNTYRLVKRDGSVITVQCAGRFQYQAGEAVRLFGIVHDVSMPAEESQRLRRYVETSGNLFLAIDVSGRIIQANQRTCLTLGLRSSRVVGENWVSRFVADADRDELERRIERVFAGDSQHYADEFEVALVTDSGDIRTVHWYQSVETDANGHPAEIVLFGADVTDQRHAETQARELAEFPMQNPNLVLRINRDGEILLGNPAVDGLLEEITSGAHPGSESDWNEIIEASRRATHRHDMEVDLVGRNFLLDVVPIVDSDYVNIYGFDITGTRDMAHRLSVITNQMPGGVFEYTHHVDGSVSIDYASEGCRNLFELEPSEINADASLVWQLVLPEHVERMHQSIGHSAETLENWVEEWQIRVASGQLKWVRGMGAPRRLKNGDVVWNTLIFDITEARSSFEALSDALKKTVSVLSAAVEIRDPYTAGHESRVATLAVQIGEKMGLDADQLEGLFLAASVHDVGKIQIPSDILSKPTRLSAIEYELVKAHSETGALLLSDIEFKWPIAEIILQHHERIDGSGYPRGLTHDDILLEARILAVADTVEAMASHRPYRPALGLKAAAKEIADGDGVRYDSEVVTAALSLIEDGKVTFDG